MCTTLALGRLPVGEVEPLPYRITRYCYRQVSGYGAYKFRLVSIKRARKPSTFHYPASTILKAGPTSVGLRKFRLFNSLYIPQCNALCIQIEFSRLDGAIFFVGTPTRYGRLAPLSDMEQILEFSEQVCECEHLKSSNLGFSLSLMVHNVVETNNGFYHIGVSLLPACSIFMQYWLSDDTFASWLSEWSGRKLEETLAQSIMVIQYQTGLVRVQSLNDASPTIKWIAA
jgi:hypothetical protein